MLGIAEMPGGDAPTADAPIRPHLLREYLMSSYKRYRAHLARRSALYGARRRRRCRWVVELEPGVWLAAWDGDPGRTLVRGNALTFHDQRGARAALHLAREYRPFARARITRCR